jgi:hypothetical protein
MWKSRDSSGLWEEMLLHMSESGKDTRLASHKAGWRDCSRVGAWNPWQGSAICTSVVHIHISRKNNGRDVTTARTNKNPTTYWITADSCSKQLSLQRDASKSYFSSTTFLSSEYLLEGATVCFLQYSDCWCLRRQVGSLRTVWLRKPQQCCVLSDHSYLYYTGFANCIQFTVLSYFPQM